jgi:hypothetical protein
MNGRLARRSASVPRRLGWLAAGLMTATAILWAPAVADAHTPSVSLTCGGGLSINLIQYNGGNGGNANTVSVSIDGVAVAGSPFSFGESYINSWVVGPPTVGHTATVVIFAFDDPDPVNQDPNYSRTYNLEIGPCQDPVPTPTPTATPAPTPTPTATPAPTPTPTPAPSGEVLGATGTPGQTPPPTDSFGTAGGPPSIDGWRGALLGMAAVIALVLTATRRSRARREDSSR